MLTKLFLLFLIGYCFGQQQFGQQPVPPFLYGASQETINSFHQLTQTFQGLPEADIEKRVGNWINGQSADIRARYTMMRAEEKERSRWREAEQAEMAAKLSPAAQAAERRFSAIEHNPRLTPQEKQQQTMQYKNSLPKNVVDEIDRMFQNQMQQHQQQREEYHKSVVARLSPAARAADERMSAIDRDPMIPPQQKMQQIQMIVNSLPQNVRNELDTAMRG